MEKKYRFENATEEDQKAFMKALDKILNELGLAFNITIVKKPISFKTENKDEVGFIDQPTIVINRKIEIVETEVVSPIQKNDLEKN